MEMNKVMDEVAKKGSVRAAQLRRDLTSPWGILGIVFCILLIGSLIWFVVLYLGDMGNDADIEKRNDLSPSESFGNNDSSGDIGNLIGKSREEELEKLKVCVKKLEDATGKAIDDFKKVKDLISNVIHHH